MPARRLSMRKIFELMRLQAEGLSIRQMAASLGLARSTVSDYLSRLERRVGRNRRRVASMQVFPGEGILDVTRSGGR